MGIAWSHDYKWVLKPISARRFFFSLSDIEHNFVQFFMPGVSLLKPDLTISLCGSSYKF